MFTLCRRSLLGFVRRQPLTLASLECASTRSESTTAVKVAVSELEQAAAGTVPEQGLSSPEKKERRKIFRDEMPRRTHLLQIPTIRKENDELSQFILFLRGNAEEFDMDPLGIVPSFETEGLSFKVGTLMMDIAKRNPDGSLTARSAGFKEGYPMDCLKGMESKIRDIRQGETGPMSLPLGLFRLRLPLWVTKHHPSHTHVVAVQAKPSPNTEAFRKITAAIDTTFKKALVPYNAIKNNDFLNVINTGDRPGAHGSQKRPFNVENLLRLNGIEQWVKIAETQEARDAWFRNARMLSRWHLPLEAELGSVEIEEVILRQITPKGFVVAGRISL